MQKSLEKLIRDARNKVELYQAPRKAIVETYSKPCIRNQCLKNLQVTVVCAPCHGFGDVVFATKFARYLKYGLGPRQAPLAKNVAIVTSAPGMFKQLGVADLKIYSLQGSQIQCRRLKNFKRPAGLPTQDLIFIAPLMQDYSINYGDIKTLFKESTPFNTIFLSEYQDNPNKGFDFTTGISDRYAGLLFDDLKAAPKLKELGRIPYILAYLADSDQAPRYCLNNFVKMVTAKYSKPALQIVLPEWAGYKLINSSSMLKWIKQRYSTLIFQTKTGTLVLFSGPGNKLILRGDILPLTRTRMLSAMKNSLLDILVTGDQSITDVINCCSKKNIWYQTVDWKKEFSKALAEHLPQPYIKKNTTTCGSLQALKWKQDSSLTFKKKHDFRRKSKHQLEAIFRAASEARKSNSMVAQYLAQLSSSRSKTQLLELVQKFSEK
jgi:hypothetical protein